MKTTVKPNSLDDGRVGVSHFAVQHLFLCVCFFPVVFLYCFLVASVSLVSTIAGIFLVANQRCLDRHALSYVWLLRRQTVFSIRIPNNETREGSKCPCYHNILLQKFAGNICCICNKFSWKGKMLTSQQVFKPTYLCRTWQQILCIMLPWPCNSCLQNRFCKDAAYVGSALMTVRNNIARLAYVDHLRLGVFRPLHKQSIWSLVQVFKKQLPHWC